MAAIVEKIDKEIATGYVNDWLDYKRIKPAQREANKGAIDALITAVSDGTLTINPDKNFLMVQKLEFPISELNLSELQFKSRVSLGDLNKSTTDSKDVFVGTVNALTGVPASHIKKLDTEDCKIGYAISLFF